MEAAIAIPTVDQLLEASAATSDFAAALRDFAANGKASERIRFSRGNPPVKVLRAICGLLEHDPSLAIENVVVEGHSGCSDYRGAIEVNGGASAYDFTWDCAWRAREQGWKDMFGDPDQIRAARTFGYRCFQHFKKTR